MIEKINIADCMVIAALAIALIMAIFYGLNELAMSIASGSWDISAAGLNQPLVKRRRNKNNEGVY